MKINVEKFKKWLIAMGKYTPYDMSPAFRDGRIDALQDVFNSVSQGDRDFMEEGDE